MNTTTILNTLNDLVDEAESLASETNDLTGSLGEIESALSQAASDTENLRYTIEEIEQRAQGFESQLRDLRDEIESHDGEDPEQMLRKAINLLVERAKDQGRSEERAAQRQRDAALARETVENTDTEVGA